MLPNQNSCWISWGNLGISEHDLMIQIPEDSSITGKRKNSRSNKKLEKHIKPPRKLAPIRLVNLSGKKEHVWDMSLTMSLNFPGQAKEHRRNSDFCCLIFGHEKQQVSGISWRTASIPNGQSAFCCYADVHGSYFRHRHRRKWSPGQPKPGWNSHKLKSNRVYYIAKKGWWKHHFISAVQKQPSSSQFFLQNIHQMAQKKLQNCQVIPLERLFFKMLFEFPTTSWCFEMCVSWGMFVWNIQIWTST